MTKKIINIVLIFLTIIFLILSFVYTTSKNIETKNVNGKIVTLTEKTESNKKLYIVTISYNNVLYDKKIEPCVYDSMKIGDNINTELDITNYETMYIGLAYLIASVICLALAGRMDD